MTLEQARKRYPHVPEDLVAWALHNVQDLGVLRRGLASLEKAIRIQTRAIAA